MRLALGFRPPLAWETLLGYLRLRAVPGVELVDATHYRRTVEIGSYRGWLAVSLSGSGKALDLNVSPSLAPVAVAVAERIANLCDLGAEPAAVAGVLLLDPLLAPTVRRLPGLRVPGAFDGFELGVRAILGQQISVKSATAVAGRWAGTFGVPFDTPYTQLSRLAPTAQRMSEVDANEIAANGVVSSRARCIAALARAVVDGRLVLNRGADVQMQIGALRQLPGIGPWTAQYIAMRALHWSDAFPGTDLMLLRAAQTTANQLQLRSEAWRPWRAYATHYLWQSLACPLAEPPLAASPCP